MKFKVTREQHDYLKTQVTSILQNAIDPSCEHPSWEVKQEFVQRLFSSFVQSKEYEALGADRKKDMLEYYFKLEKTLTILDDIEWFLARTFNRESIDYIQDILFPKPKAA